MSNLAIAALSAGEPRRAAPPEATPRAALPRREAQRRRADAETRLVLHGHESPWREAIQGLVRREYRRHFDADVREFMPSFLALHDAADEIAAVVGCRSAASGPLFLEIYSDRPIEMLIAERAAVNVSREDIVEIGSLVCKDAYSAMAIVRALVPFLIEAGYGWVVFTGADTVVRVLRRLNLLPLALCIADSERLGAAREDWGNYYKHSPVVMAGRLLDGLNFLANASSVG